MLAPMNALNDVTAAAERIGLPAQALEALPAVKERIEAHPELVRAFAHFAKALAEREPTAAIAEVEKADLEHLLGAQEARGLYLALALTQVAAAEARHAEQGVQEEVSRATLADLAVWVRHFAAQTGAIGITLEILDWAQRYLRGDLYGIGALQFELRPFEGSMKVHRHLESRRLALTWLEEGADGRVIDATSGEITSLRAPRYDRAEWEIALEPGTSAFDMHIPAGAQIGVPDFAHAIRDAYAFFDALRPGVVAVGACGEGWLLDPQMGELLPDNEGLHAIRRACCLYPSALSEAKTIRRLFGPDVERSHLPYLPRDGMTKLQQALLAFLADPAKTLRARGGLILKEELDAILAAEG
jgi:hypothetical protein